MEKMSYRKGTRHTEEEKKEPNNKKVKISPSLLEIIKCEEIKFSNQKVDIGRMEIKTDPTICSLQETHFQIHK